LLMGVLQRVLSVRSLKKIFSARSSPGHWRGEEEHQ
jgi:hypothetical protein